LTILFGQLERTGKYGSCRYKKIGKLAGDFLHQYAKTHAVTMADALVGAAAKVNLFKLWTMNKKHYPMFERSEYFE